MSLTTESGRDVEGLAKEVLGTVSVDKITGTVLTAAATADPVRDQTPLLMQIAVLKELRAIRELLALAQGMPAVFEPLPEIAR